MKLTVKTLKGGKFQVDCEPSNTVAQAKGIIVSFRIKDAKNYQIKSRTKEYAN